MDKNRSRLSKEFLEGSLIYFLAGLGLVAALAWNDAVQGLFNEIFGGARGSLIAKFGYALLITVVVTFVSWRLGRNIGPK